MNEVMTKFKFEAAVLMPAVYNNSKLLTMLETYIRDEFWPGVKDHIVKWDHLHNAMKQMGWLPKQYSFRGFGNFIAIVCFGVGEKEKRSKMSETVRKNMNSIERTDPANQNIILYVMANLQKMGKESDSVTQTA